MTNREKLLKDNPILDNVINLPDKIALSNGVPVLCTSIFCSECDFKLNPSCVTSCIEWLDKEVTE